MQSNSLAVRSLDTGCCIAGGGPAGMMLGFLLARAGIDVVVLEKHADFLRDFRGDTIHPSTLEVMHDLGLLDALLALPHTEARELGGIIGGERIRLADFTHLPTRCKFIALMPQWDLLDFIARHGRAYPGFHLEMLAEATDLLGDGTRIEGVAAKTPGGRLEVRADLVVAADGRHSTLRTAAGFTPDEIGAPMDVLWFRLPRGGHDPASTLGYIDAGHMLVMIDRGDYWQCGYVIPKNSIERLRAQGIEAVHEGLNKLIPFAAERIARLTDWNDLHLLTVAVDRLPVWHRPGFLCIGDAAHAMSPVGGVGINLAIQDAVAAANMLWEPLRRRHVDDATLAAFQRRREWPVRVTQRLQVAIQKRVVGRVLSDAKPIRVPWIARLIDRIALLRRIPAYLIGIGVRPERPTTPAVPPRS